MFLGKGALKICTKFTGELYKPKCHFNKVALHSQTMFTKREGKGMVFDIFLSFPSVSAILFKPKRQSSTLS